MSRRGARVLVAAAVAAVPLLTGCGDGDPTEAGPTAAPAPPVGEWADESAKLPPLRLSEQPLWTEKENPELTTIAGAEFRGDTMIARPSAADGEQVAVLDATNGAPKWTLAHLDELAGGNGAAWWASSEVAGSDDDWVILVEYIRDSCDHPTGWCPPSDGSYTSEFGIAALSPADGSVLWMTPIVPAVPSDSAEADLDLGLTMEGVDASTALVSVAPSEGVYGAQPVPVEQVRSVAVNVADGAIRWDEPGQWPVAVAGDTVLAVDGPARPGGHSSVPMTIVDGSMVVGLDAATGERDWELTDHAVSDVVASVGDYAVVRAGKSGDLNELSHPVIDPSTGEEVADLGKGSHKWCASDGTAFVACLLDVGEPGSVEPHLASFDAGSESAIVSTAPASDGVTTISGVAEGYTFVGGYGVDKDNYALDPTGEDPTGPLPGMFVGMSDRYAVFATFTEASVGSPTGFVIHEVLD